MGKFVGVEDDIFSIFAGNAWKANGIATIPSNFTSDASEFVRISVLANGSGVNLKSLSGILMADIFTAAGEGPRRSSVIADMLSLALDGKSINTQGNSVTQFGSSALTHRGLDSDNPTLHRSTFSIPFNYFGV